MLYDIVYMRVNVFIYMYVYICYLLLYYIECFYENDLYLCIFYFLKLYLSGIY